MVSNRSWRGPKRSRSHGSASGSAEGAPAGRSSWSCQGGRRCAARPSRSRERSVGRLWPSSACLTLMITQRVRVNKRMKAKSIRSGRQGVEQAGKRLTVHARSQHAACGPPEAMLHDLLRCAARGAVVTLPLVGIALLLLARPGAGSAARNVDHRPAGREPDIVIKKGLLNAGRWRGRRLTLGGWVRLCMSGRGHLEGGTRPRGSPAACGSRGRGGSEGSAG